MGSFSYRTNKYFGFTVLGAVPGAQRIAQIYNENKDVAWLSFIDSAGNCQPVPAGMTLYMRIPVGPQWPWVAGAAANAVPQVATGAGNTARFYLSPHESYRLQWAGRMLDFPKQQQTAVRGHKAASNGHGDGQAAMLAYLAGRRAHKVAQHGNIADTQESSRA